MKFRTRIMYRREGSRLLTDLDIPTTPFRLFMIRPIHGPSFVGNIRSASGKTPSKMMSKLVHADPTNRIIVRVPPVVRFYKILFSKYRQLLRRRESRQWFFPRGSGMSKVRLACRLGLGGNPQVTFRCHFGRTGHIFTRSADLALVGDNDDGKQFPCST